MKITILKDKKKIFVKGQTDGIPVKEYLDLFFNTEDFDEYQVEHEKIAYSYPAITKEQSTTNCQVPD